MIFIYLLTCLLNSLFLGYFLRKNRDDDKIFFIGIMSLTGPGLMAFVIIIVVVYFLGLCATKLFDKR